MLNNKTILITGGTGSFGKECVKIILKKYPKVKKLIIFSRDELKQHEMSLSFPSEKYPNLRFFLGDIRDKNRLKIALEDVDYVIHAAALKQVPAAEYNPYEFIQTNILGSNNLIEACISRGVKKIIALSTDKAAAPINLYGATKLCSDKLFISANNIVGKKNIVFSVVRYGNVMMSRGSVIPIFLEDKKKKLLKITDKRMTRFNITLNQGVNFVLFALKESIGQEIFVPRLPSYNILDLAKSISPSSKIKIIGIRNGEKLHEEMITISDSFNTIENKDFYVILPSNSKNLKNYLKKYKAKKIYEPFSYNSFDNKQKLNIKEIKKLLTIS
jgi:UDP-N-acetylglucosamine 4,6-dehydratase/5-epimerase